MIPLFDPKPALQQQQDEINKAIQRVFEHGQFILGPEVNGFEMQAAKYLGAKYGVGVNSGTDALVIAMRAAGIGPGDEVITTPFSFFATAESISMTGAKPVFADVEEGSYNIDPARIEEAITDRTKAILPVHLFGRPCDMDAIMELAAEHNLLVLEDCAQSFGTEYKGRRTGSIGYAGAFSFFPTKNLGGAGDGGLIVTDDFSLAMEARKLRVHGSDPGNKYSNEILGYNSRLDTLQAAVLLVKLKQVDKHNEERRRIAAFYEEHLGEADGIRTPEPAEGHVFHQYTVRVPGGKRDELRERLKERGIGTGVYYPVPQHRLPVYREKYGDTGLPVAERLAEEVLSLPIFPGMTEEQLERVVEVLRGVLAEV